MRRGCAGTINLTMEAFLNIYRHTVFCPPSPGESNPAPNWIAADDGPRIVNSIQRAHFTIFVRGYSVGSRGSRRWTITKQEVPLPDSLQARYNVFSLSNAQNNPGVSTLMRVHNLLVDGLEIFRS